MSTEPPTPNREPAPRDREPAADRAPPRRAADDADIAFRIATREAEADRMADAPEAQDASGARLESGPDAGRIARSLGARAVTIGDSILFAPGEHAPETPTGRRLVAHELAHVVQQRREGRARVDRQPAGKSLEDRVRDLCMELDAASRPLDRALVQKATELGKEAVGVLGRLKSATPAASPDALETARDSVKRLVRSLVSGEAEDAAMDLALASGDPEIQSAAVTAVRGRASGVAGQRRVVSKIGRLAGETIPTATAGQTSADWLERQTEAAGRTFKKLETMGLKGLGSKPLSLELAQELLEQYFTAAPKDVKPDPGGKVSGLSADTTTKQLEADCDVYATYGARLLRAAGWQTAGYLAIVPDESTGRDAHAVALVKRAAAAGGFDYAGVSNAELRELGNAATDDAARAALLKLARDVYRSPEPARWKAYYLPAGANGAYDVRLLDPAKHGLTPFAQQP